VNERLGVKSTYEGSSHQYTTVLDTNSDFYKQRVAGATKKASAIEKAPTKNIHLLEERTGVLLTADSETNEEDRFSSVLPEKSSESPSTPNKKHVPPTRKNETEKDQVTPKKDSPVPKPQSSNSKTDSPTAKDGQTNQATPKNDDAGKKQGQIAEFMQFSAEIDSRRRTSASSSDKPASTSQLSPPKKESGLRPDAKEFKPRGVPTFVPAEQAWGAPPMYAQHKPPQPGYMVHGPHSISPSGFPVPTPGFPVQPGRPPFYTGGPWQQGPPHTFPPLQSPGQQSPQQVAQQQQNRTAAAAALSLPTREFVPGSGLVPTSPPKKESS